MKNSVFFKQLFSSFHIIKKTQGNQGKSGFLFFNLYFYIHRKQLKNIIKLSTIVFVNGRSSQ